MRALITGASSGLGRDMAIILSRQGYELILVARSRNQLMALLRELPTPSEIVATDLSSRAACVALYDKVKGQPLDILINNAGMGVYGEFAATRLADDLELVALNIEAVHILTKLFLADMITADHGAILNVASLAAFLPGPMMAGYYASKAYVLRLSEAIYEELRQRKSKVSISVLCPGPVSTDFNRRAGVSHGAKGLSSPVVAAYALKKMSQRKLLIFPGLATKLFVFGQRLLSDKLLLRLLYAVQKLKKPLSN